MLEPESRGKYVNIDHAMYYECRMITSFHLLSYPLRVLFGEIGAQEVPIAGTAPGSSSPNHLIKSLIFRE